MKKRGNFVTYQQLNIMDCGPTCLRMVAKYHGSQVDINTIRRNAGFNKGGVSLLGISDAAENIGFRTRAVQVTQDQLIKQVPHPCILHWEQNHFVVLPPLKTSWFTRTSILIADPAKGLIRYSNEEFRKYWISSVNEMGTGIGTVLILEPTALNYDSGEINGVHKWSLPINYLKRNIRSITQVILSLLVASVFQLIIPLLTQSIIDTGINTQNIQYISLVLLAQLMLIFSRTIVDFVRGRILLFVSININVSLLSDFWIKLTRLPMSYFDSYHLGDTLQRLEDSKSIERFMTSNAISSFFSIFTFFIFSFVLALYSTTVLSVFIIGGALYFLWISFFLKFRRKVNYQLFSLSAKENVASLQMIQGMQELKLNNAEKLKRWEWENIQASVFKLSLKNLSYSQLQQAGAIFINEGKNVIIIFLVAQLVIEGRLTLGAMLAIQYIIGQLNSPIEQFIGFLQAFQDAKISMERLNEIHGLPEENTPDIILSGNEIMPINKSVILKNVSFSYPGIDQEPILSQINLLIEEGKTTAIVGVSGSGKTTLLKLLLKFYDSYKGEIQIGKEASINSPNNLINFSNINPAFWRSQCGAVLQDGFIFNDTIAKNIAVGFDAPEMKKLISACQTANIMPFIQSLPNGFNTKIGTDGVGMSQGQKQRILIARAVYKNPQFIFLDEATNALDSNNEKTIIQNLQNFFTGRTVVIVAHRLSTVKNANSIIVMDSGRIAEKGTHDELTKLKGKYYNLVKNQLELGN